MRKTSIIVIKLQSDENKIYTHKLGKGINIFNLKLLFLKKNKNQTKLKGNYVKINNKIDLKN